ncbi:MAG: SEC-C domain-containing protein, partial [Magnetococcales bacterium]|nr:SEC-C domain-containing protein [Magnetococcales bacterium]
AGMTGTADTEATEFQAIYNLEVVVVPTNRPMVRVDHDDVVFRTLEEKYQAILEEIVDCNKRGQPVLVGTISIEKSEELSRRLKKHKIAHSVLNAKFHAQEAEIVAQAGRTGAVTIATNMAGRGTDIQLGGNPDMRIRRELPADLSGEERQKREAAIRAECETDKGTVIAAGGLHILATERHESRRIDNQLRGRSGRQGDPGSSRFYLSLQDDLMRIFGSERMDAMLVKLGLREGEAIVHPWINKAIESAQKKVEGRNFDIRKNLLRFDDVMNEQRKVVYEQRRELMESEEIADYVAEIREELLEGLMEKHIPETVYPEQWQAREFADAAFRQFGIQVPAESWKEEEHVTAQVVRERTRQAIQHHNAEREERIGGSLLRYLEKSVLLQILDHLWKEHLLNMDHLKEGIHLRGYAQRDPLNEYKREAFELFEGLLDRIRAETVEVLSRVEVQQPEEVQRREEELAAARDRLLAQQQAQAAEEDDEDDEDNKTPYRRSEQKVGRNALCPCGSGRKYKHCCGSL